LAAKPDRFTHHSEQYRFADRDFRNGDRVVFVGPPDDEFQPGMMPEPSKHLLWLSAVG